MDRRYYTFWFRVDAKNRCAIWSDNDYSKLWLDVNGMVPSFDSRHELELYAGGAGVTLLDFEFGVVDLDELKDWLTRPGLELDCDLVLNAWNLFDDLKTAVYGEESYQSELHPSAIYDKLYFGTNPSVLTPPNKEYIPIWSDTEIEEVKATLSDGLKLFRSRLISVGD